jgi:Fungal cellulose binding domain
VQASLMRALAAALACLLVALTPIKPAAAAKCAYRYDQCGGIKWVQNGGTTCCVKYNECVKKNKYYSQCLPTPPPEGIVPWFGQCGGVGYTGATKCEPYSKCVGGAAYESCEPLPKYVHGTE